MSKLRETKGFGNVETVLKTRIEGLYFRNLGWAKLAELQQLARQSQQLPEEPDDDMEIIYWVFFNLVCDESGEPFEDLLTNEDLNDLPVSFVGDVVKEANRIMGELHRVDEGAS